MESFAGAELLKDVESSHVLGAPAPALALMEAVSCALRVSDVPGIVMLACVAGTHHQLKTVVSLVGLWPTQIMVS